MCVQFGCVHVHVFPFGCDFFTSEYATWKSLMWRAIWKSQVRSSSMSAESSCSASDSISIANSFASCGTTTLSGRRHVALATTQSRDVSDSLYFSLQAANRSG